MFSQPLYRVHLAVPLSARPGPGGMGHLPLNLLWSWPAHTGAQAVFHDLWGKMLAFLGEGEAEEAGGGRFPFLFFSSWQDVAARSSFQATH